MLKTALTLLARLTLFLWPVLILDGFAWADQAEPETFACKKIDTQVAGDKRQPQKNRWIYGLFGDEEVFLVRDFVNSGSNKRGKKLSGKLNDQMRQRGAFYKDWGNVERDLFASASVALLENDSLLVVGAKFRVKYFCEGAYEKVWNTAPNVMADSDNGAYETNEKDLVCFFQNITNQSAAKVGAQPWRKVYLDELEVDIAEFSIKENGDVKWFAQNSPLAARARDVGWDFSNAEFTLINNGKLIGSAGRQVGRVAYQCNWTLLEVKSALREQKHLEQVQSTNTLAQKRIAELEAKLAQIENQANSNDESNSELFRILIDKAVTDGPEGIIEGTVVSARVLEKMAIDGRPLEFDAEGRFRVKTYVPDGGLSVKLEAVDVAGLSTSLDVQLNRVSLQTSSLVFDRLNPIKRSSVGNADALALIVGISNYRETHAEAIYADGDAKVFRDYAAEKLGVPRSRIKALVNDQANEKEVLLASKRWISRAVKQEQSDVYIFFAGHGLASDDGEKMYLLPYDGTPELLDKTAILRQELFSDIAAANPRSVTVFLDTCYSGTTRGTDMLIASRPIAIRAREQSIPDGFTVMTAAAGDQTAKPLEEAKHGMFSYFLMKGMEGDADANQDNQITAGELHAYVQQNVIQQSSGSQTPELQGDADRVLVRFQ